MWDCAKLQELISIFENNCIVCYKQFTFPSVINNLAPDAKEEHIISIVIKSYIHRTRCLKETLTIIIIIQNVCISLLVVLLCF